MRVYLISLVCLLTLLINGCGISLTPAGESPDLPPLNPQEVPTQQLPDSPAQGDATPMSTQLPTPADSYLQSLIEKAKEDLAQRLSISITQINLVETVSVTWPDGSLGCAQTGGASAQVLTPGYIILLKHDNNQYEYHTNKNTYVIYCANPTPPIFGSPNQ